MENQNKNKSKAPKRRCLSDFEENNVVSLFHDAIEPVPNYLEQIMMEGKKKFKIFQNDNQAHLKIFIFHYLHLCFDKEKPENSSDYLEKIY